MSNHYIPFILISLVHIISCVHGWQRLRVFTKALVLPALAFGYCLSTDAPVPAKLAALGLDWIGELLFIDPEVKWRRYTAVAFFFGGHIFYSIAMMKLLSPIDGGLLPCAALWLAIVAAAAFVCVKLYPTMRRKLWIFGVAYFVLLTFVACVAAALLVQGYPGGLMLLCGSLVFLASDSMLCLENFSDGNAPDKFEICVMASYVTAQFLLTMGLNM